MKNTNYSECIVNDMKFLDRKKRIDLFPSIGESYVGDVLVELVDGGRYIRVIVRDNGEITLSRLQFKCLVSQFKFLQEKTRGIGE